MSLDTTRVEKKAEEMVAPWATSKAFQRVGLSDMWMAGMTVEMRVVRMVA